MSKLLAGYIQFREILERNLKVMNIYGLVITLNIGHDPTKIDITFILKSYVILT